MLTSRSVPARAAHAASTDRITGGCMLSAVTALRAVPAVVQSVTGQLTARTCLTETTPAPTGDWVAVWTLRAVTDTAAVRPVTASRLASWHCCGGGCCYCCNTRSGVHQRLAIEWLSEFFHWNTLPNICWPRTVGRVASTINLFIYLSRNKHLRETCEKKLT